MKEKVGDRPPFLRQFVVILGSQVGMGLVGFVCLPFLTRGLGVDSYGTFSLFMIIVGATLNLEFGRTLFIRQFANLEDGDLAKLTWISWINIGVSVFLGALAAVLFLPSQLAFSISVIVLFHSLSAPYFASLANEGKIEKAISIRNIFWSGALVVLTGGIWKVGADFPIALPFVIANIAVYLIYRASTQFNMPTPARCQPGELIVFLRKAIDLIIFNISGAVIVTTEKGVLRRFISPAAFGQYAAQADMAIKINMVSNAIGNALYPNLIEKHQTEGLTHATLFFKKVFGIFFSLYFVASLALICFSSEIVGTFLGEDFSTVIMVFPLFVSIVFVSLLGFLLVPWQRAQGDFRTSRRTYLISAGLVVGVSLFAIPLWGIPGGVLALASARLGDIYMLIRFIRAAPDGTIKTYELCLVAIMMATVIGVAIHGSGLL